MPPTDFAFGPYVFDPGQLLLRRGGEALPLGRRAGLLLDTLLRHRGRVVSKQDLVDAAWPGEAVEESNLSVQIGKLRRFIGADRIRTVERVGYQFVQEDAVVARAVAPTLAIRPFGNGPEAASVVADLIAALVPFRSLSVIAAADSAAADYCLEGSTERGAGGLQLAARLIDMRTGAYRWAQRFECGDHAPERERIAGQIAAMVENEIELIEIGRWRGEGGTEDGRALYRRAQFHLRTSRPQDYAIATTLLERALELDPHNVAYLAAMCEALHHRIAMGWPALQRDDAGRCLAFARRGLDQPEADGYATALFGTAIYRTADPDSGYSLMHRGAMLNPNNLTALVYAATASLHWGSLEDAEALYRQALELHPRHPSQGFVMGGLARIEMIAGRFEAALDWAQRAYPANPNYGATHWTLVAANAQLKRTEEAGLRLARFRSLQPGVTIAAIRNGQPTRSSRLDSTLEGLAMAGLD